jgi:hypothetical protein
MNPNSKKPKLLDWIKERTGSYHENLDPRAHGHDTWAAVFNEIRQDEMLAKVRDETGKEPSNRALEDGLKRPVPEPPAPNWRQTLTKNLNPVKSEYASAWRTTRADGRSQFRQHVGKSIEGFHGGLEISLKKGFSTLKWSNPRPDLPRAEQAASGMVRAWEKRCAAIERSVDAEFGPVTPGRNQKPARSWER